MQEKKIWQKIYKMILFYAPFDRITFNLIILWKNSDCMRKEKKINGNFEKKYSYNNKFRNFSKKSMRILGGLR